MVCAVGDGVVVGDRFCQMSSGFEVRSVAEVVVDIIGHDGDSACYLRQIGSARGPQRFDDAWTEVPKALACIGGGAYAGRMCRRCTREEKKRQEAQIRKIDYCAY